MKSIDIIKTVSKVFGLYLIVQTVINFRDIIYYVIFATTGENEQYVMLLGASAYKLLFNLIVAVLLVFKSDWTAIKLRPDDTEPLKINLLKSDWIELAIIVISGLTIIYSVPEIMFKLVNFIYFNDFDENERQLFWTNKNKADIFYSIFKFIIALFCLLNSRNFSKRLIRLADREDRLKE
jgi:hypothetical protein